MAFKRAEKTQGKLRLALFGPPGAGKTMTALRMATGIAEVIKGKIAVIDSERGRSEKYGDKFNFDINTLEDKDIVAYKKAIEESKLLGYDILIIDSFSHAWYELTKDMDELSEKKFNGMGLRAWKTGTPIQRDFIEFLFSYPGHIIVTMRSNTEYLIDVVENNGSRKHVIKKVGLKPQQGKEAEYEFDMLMELDREHVGRVEKDITDKFQHKEIIKPDENFGKEIINWLLCAPPAKPVERTPAEEKTFLLDKCKVLGITFTDAEKTEMKSKSVEEQVIALKAIIQAKEAK